MATNHTTNYNLNLWEPSDNFVREEFNENTSKIDAALHGLAQSKASVSTTTALQNTLNAHSARMDAIAAKSNYTKLLDVTITQETSESYSCDISQIQWDQWFQVVFVIKLNGSGRVRLRLNNAWDGFWASNYGSSNSGGIVELQPSSVYTSVLFFTPVWDATSCVTALGLSDTLSFGYSSVRYSNLQTLDMLIHNPSGNTPGKITGGTIQAYGIK